MKFQKAALIALAVSIAPLLAACEGNRYFLAKVESDEVGVRVWNLPFVNHIEQKALFTGYPYFHLHKITTFYTLPRGDMTIEMIERGKIEFKIAGAAVEALRAVPEQVPDGTAVLPQEQLDQVKSEIAQSDRIQIVVHDRRSGNESVRVKTADGNDAWVDVIVTFKIIDDKPYRVIQTVGVSKEEVEKFVASMVRGTIRSWLSELDSKEILRAMDRDEKLKGLFDDKGKLLQEGAIHALNKQLEQFGIYIVALNAPTVAIHPDYEAILSKKRMAEEEKEEYVAYQLKAEQEKQTKVNKARGEADAIIELAIGRMARIKQEADALLQAKKFEAEATEIKYNQLADGIAAQTAVLGGPGGEAYVGLAITNSLMGKPIIIVPAEAGINTLDINEILQTYGGVKAITVEKKADQTTSEQK